MNDYKFEGLKSRVTRIVSLASSSLQAANKTIKITTPSYFAGRDSGTANAMILESNDYCSSIELEPQKLDCKNLEVYASSLCSADLHELQNEKRVPVIRVSSIDSDNEIQQPSQVYHSRKYSSSQLIQGDFPKKQTLKQLLATKTQVN